MQRKVDSGIAVGVSLALRGPFLNLTSRKRGRCRRAWVSWLWCWRMSKCPPTWSNHGQIDWLEPRLAVIAHYLGKAWLLLLPLAYLPQANLTFQWLLNDHASRGNHKSHQVNAQTVSILWLFLVRDPLKLYFREADTFSYFVFWFIVKRN